MKSYIDKIEALDACPPAIEWLREKNYATLQEAWDNCERGDWMLWLYGRLNKSAPWSDERKPLVLAACACARLSLPSFEARFPADSRPRRCIEVTEAWCRGEASREQVVSARNAAYAATAYAADAAATYAAAAYAAAAYAAAAAAAYAADREECALIVRSMLPCPVLA